MANVANAFVPRPAAPIRPDRRRSVPNGGRPAAAMAGLAPATENADARLTRGCRFLALRPSDAWGTRTRKPADALLPARPLTSRGLPMRPGNGTQIHDFIE